VHEHTLIWEAPPRRRTGRNANAYKMALTIAKRKGEWANIAQYPRQNAATNRASEIRTGKIEGFADVGTFEAMVRQTGKDEYSVFVRCTRVKKKAQEDLDRG